MRFSDFVISNVIVLSYNVHLRFIEIQPFRKVVGTANHFLAPILGAKENDGESLQKSRQKISDEGNEEAAPSKREGWKADALLKHFDDGIIETIETEVSVYLLRRNVTFK